MVAVELTSAPILVRPATPGDVGFCVANWVRTYEQSMTARELGGHYRSRWSAVVNDLLARTTVLVATDADRPDILLGFLCGESDGGRVVHYCYVKQPFRRNGIMRALLAQLLPGPGTVRYTHRTAAALAYSQAHAGWIYDPTKMWLP